MRRTFAVVFALASICGLTAADRREITFSDARIFPESLTSTSNGDIYIGSLGRDAVYRATSASARAMPWIRPKTNGLITVLGVLADESSGVLLVCTSTPGPHNSYIGGTAVKVFRLKDASLQASHPFPGDGLCNDIAVARDGTIYATDTTQARVMRLRKGAAAFDVWAKDATALAGVDGIVVAADGQVYVNSVGQGTLMRIDVKADGSAGAITKIETSRPLQQPDGMRLVAGRTVLLVEGAGRLDEVTINGNKAAIKVLKDGMVGATSVTLTGGNAYVLEGKLALLNDRTKDPGPFKAFGIPYKAPK